MRSLVSSILDGAWRFASALLCLLAIAAAGRAEAGVQPELKLQMTTHSLSAATRFQAHLQPPSSDVRPRE